MRNFSDEQFILFFANQHRELFNEVASDFHEFSDPIQRGVDRIRKMDRFEHGDRERQHDLHKGGVDPESGKPSIKSVQEGLDWSKIPKRGEREGPDPLGPAPKRLNEFAVSAMKPPASSVHGPRHRGLLPGGAGWDSGSTYNTHVRYTSPAHTMKTRAYDAAPGKKGYRQQSPRTQRAEDRAEKGQIELNRTRRGRIHQGGGMTGPSEQHGPDYKGDPTWDGPKLPTKQPRGGPYMKASEFSHLNEFAKAKDFMKDYSKAVAGHRSDTRFERTANKKRLVREATQKAVGDLSSGKLPGKNKAPFGYGIKNLNEFDCKRRVALGRKMLRFMEGSYA